MNRHASTVARGRSGMSADRRASPRSAVAAIAAWCNRCAWSSSRARRPASGWSPAACSAACSATRSAAAAATPWRRSPARARALTPATRSKRTRRRKPIGPSRSGWTTAATRNFTYTNKPAVNEGERVKLVDGGRRLGAGRELATARTPRQNAGLAPGVLRWTPARDSRPIAAFRLRWALPLARRTMLPPSCRRARRRRSAVPWAPAPRRLRLRAGAGCGLHRAPSYLGCAVRLSRRHWRRLRASACRATRWLRRHTTASAAPALPQASAAWTARRPLIGLADRCAPPRCRRPVWCRDSHRVGIRCGGAA